jgi:predicted  nucleic acid-binding Zn-ribbon protein
MRKGHTRGLFLAGIILLAGSSLVQGVKGQNNKTPEDKEAIQELLSEVRMLRQALQTLHRMNLDTYRSQLLSDRIRANREDVRGLTTALNETRDTLAKTQNAIPQFVDRLKLLENQVVLEVDQQKRADLEFEVKRTKDGIQMYKSQIEPLKEREQQLAADLNTEKSRLQELESRLDLLERGIENDRQKLDSDKPAAAKNP